MNIAYISNVVYPFVQGGAQKRIDAVGQRLADDHVVTIYCRQYWDGPDEITRKGMTLRSVAPGARLYNGDQRRSIREAIEFAARLVPTLRSHIDEHDLVVASVFPYFPVLSSKLCTLLTDTPIVVTWHEVWGDYWDEYLGRLSPFGKSVERLTAEIPHHAVAVSEITADRLAKIGPSRDEIDLIPNGINVDRIQNAPLPEKSFRADGKPGFDIVFAGRHVEVKHVDLLLDAFDRVADSYDATLGVLGNGPLHDELREQADALNHAGRVRFLGFLDDYDDVLGHLRAARVFASPSTREGFGITYAEAMAAGCTVIGANHPDSAASEVIGDAGYLTDPTVDDVADALSRALDGYQPPTAPTTRAMRFDWDTVAEETEGVYRRVLDHHRTRTRPVKRSTGAD